VRTPLKIATFAVGLVVVGGDGTWRIPLMVGSAGQYRLFADFRPAASPARRAG
jgi:hypothetical protein